MRSVRAGVLVCGCWARSEAGIDADHLVTVASALPGVVHAEATDDLCGAGKADLAGELVHRHGLDRLVVAACACCSLHQRCPACDDERAGLRDAVLARTGLPWSHHRFVNVRDHAASRNDGETMIAMAIASLAATEREVPPRPARRPVQSALVVGAGTRGREVALELGARGINTHLVDLASPAERRGAPPDNVKVHTPARVLDVKGGAGEFVVVLEGLGTSELITVGALVVAPGIAEEQSGAGVGWGLPHQTMASPPRRVQGTFLATRDVVTVAGAADVFLGREVTGTEAMAIVDEDACIGCLKCLRVCPYSAIGPVAVKVEGGRYSHTGQVVSVDPLLCTGCGACASSCMNLAVDIASYTTRELEAAIGAALARTGSLALICNWAAYRAFDQAARAGHLPAGLVAISVPCIARVSPHLVRVALDHGADPLLIVGCHEDGCHYRGRRALLNDHLRHMAPGLAAQGDLDRVFALALGPKDTDLLVAKVDEALEERSLATEGIKTEETIDVPPTIPRGWGD